MLRAYNDWHIDEWCGTYPGRFIPLSLPPIWDPELMADEVRRVAKKGCHAVSFTEDPRRCIGAAQHPQRALGSLLAGLLDEGTVHHRRHPHRLGPGMQFTSHGGARGRDDHHHAHEHRELRGRPAVVAHAAQVP